MSLQLSLTWKASHSGGEAWRQQLEILRASVEHLGRKEVAFELDVNGSTLSDALNERDRKRWAAEWTHVVKAMLAARRDPVSCELLHKLIDSEMANTPFIASEAILMTPDEEAAVDRFLEVVRGRRR